MARVPVNPRVLSWALSDSARTVNDVAQATGRSVETVREWLSGDAQPWAKDVAAFAKLLGRSSQFFLLPSPPSTASTYAARFRSAPGQKSEDRTAEEIDALRAAYRIQKVARWAKGDDGVDLPKLGDEPGTAARQLSDWLSWSTAVQVKATSKSAAFRQLRSAVEDRGIIVLLRDVGQRNCRGFSLPDTVAPLALVNKGYKYASVRSYTLLHELAHLANQQEFVCHDRDTKTERWCNLVAANFLMPAAHVRQYVTSQIADDIADNDTDAVRKVAWRYKTSWEAAAIRLKELGLAGDGLIYTVRNTIEDEGSGFSRIPRTTPIIRLDEYGSTYARIVLDAVDDNRLSSLDARRYLNVNGNQLAGVSQLLKGA